jgi:hypothetical protein
MPRVHLISPSTQSFGGRRLHSFRVVCAIALLALQVRSMNAQTLGLQGNHLSVAEHPEFLVFVSYFDGLRRPAGTSSRCEPAHGNVLACDFAYLRSKGVDGVRVLMNWNCESDRCNADPAFGRWTPLMNPDGSLDDAVVRRLLTLVDYAAANGLVVDVTFNHEKPWGGGGNCYVCSATAYKWGPDRHGGIVGTAEALAGRPNVLFDLQNEWNVNGTPECGRGCTEEARVSYLRDVRNAVKGVDPLRIVTASRSSYAPAARAEMDAARDARVAGFDVLAYHDGRDSTWAEDTAGVVERLRADAGPIPIYLQEPCAFGYPGCTNAELDYEEAVGNAKRAGAAAWTFHSRAGFKLNSTTPFRDLLSSGERTFLERVGSAARIGPSPGGKAPLRSP